jgi:hypothetical protein
MNNRIEDMLYPEDAPAIPVFRHPAPPEDSKNYPLVVKQWALQHPVPCLAAAFALGALVAWFVKRK